MHVRVRVALIACVMSCVIIPGLAWPEFVLSLFAKNMFLACFALNMCMSLLAGHIGL